jgi:hypothetical protein
MTEKDDPSSLGVAPAPKVDGAASVNEFFCEVVSNAVAEQGYDTTVESKAYVTALLADYATPHGGRQFLRQPMGTSLLLAMQSHSAERFNRLRAVGDEALFLSGFFADHLSQRGLELSYASDLGSVAYDAAAQFLRRLHSSSAPDVFSELARKFGMFVELLQVVSDSLQSQAVRSEASLLELYERWRRSGSNRIGDALVQRGIMPMAGDRTLH